MILRHLLVFDGEDQDGAIPPRPLTGDMILNSVWVYEWFPNTRTVDAHVVKLRQKLDPDPNTPRHFLTVHGVGYRFLP
jgi:DNA-binding response OmpR family regulator